MRTLIPAAAAAAVLATAGIAVARGVDASLGTVRATFTATAVGTTDTRTCRTSAGTTFTSTRATYTGTAAGSPELSGPVTIEARATVDTSQGVGVVSGTIKVAATASHFTAVYDHGSIAGTATGKVGPQMLLATISAGYSATGGFTSGRIGEGTAAGSAVVLPAGSCGAPPPSPVPAPAPAGTHTAHGAITALSPGSITVGALTCAVPATQLRITVAFDYSVGERVKIACTDVSGTPTLVKIDKG